MLEGVFAAIDDGWFIAEIADSAYALQSKMAKGEWLQVGVNAYTEGDDTTPSTLRIDPSVEAHQRARLAGVKRAAVTTRSETPSSASVPRPGPVDQLDASPDRCSEKPRDVGEAMAALESVFGTWYEHGSS